MPVCFFFSLSFFSVAGFSPSLVGESCSCVGSVVGSWVVVDGVGKFVAEGAILVVDAVVEVVGGWWLLFCKLRAGSFGVLTFVGSFVVVDGEMDREDTALEGGSNGDDKSIGRAAVVVATGGCG